VPWDFETFAVDGAHHALRAARQEAGADGRRRGGRVRPGRAARRSSL